MVNNTTSLGVRPSYVPLKRNSNLNSKQNVRFQGVGNFLSDKFAKNVMAKGSTVINSTKDFSAPVKLTATNGTLFSAVLACALGVSLRPATIMAMPGNPDDKKYSAVKSIATGLTSLFLLGSALILVQKGLNKAGKKFYQIEADKLFNKSKKTDIDKVVHDKLNKINEGKDFVMDAVTAKADAAITKKTETFKTLTSYGFKWILGVAEAKVLFAMIPPIMSKVFPKKNSHSADKKPEVKKEGVK